MSKWNTSLKNGFKNFFMGHVFLRFLYSIFPQFLNFQNIKGVLRA